MARLCGEVLAVARTLGRSAQVAVVRYSHQQVREQRADYSQNVFGWLAAPPEGIVRQGFSVQNLGYMRQLYLAFPQGSELPEIRQALPGELRDGAIRQASPFGLALCQIRHRIAW